MESAATEAANSFLEKGILGAIIVVLALVIVVLWRTIEARNATILQLQEKRIEEGRVTVTALNSNTVTLEGLKDALKVRRD